MGLQCQLTDVSSESLLVLMVTLVAAFVDHLRSFLSSVLKSIGFSFLLRPDHVAVDQTLYGTVGSGLAGLVLLAEQLSLNRRHSYRFDSSGGGSAGSDCVVCLNELGDGERVRRLACRHVFHKDCFDGWLDHIQFSCPLCRKSLVSDERVAETHRRVSEDILAWFPSR